MGDERGPWIGSAWMVSTQAGPSRAPRPRVLLAWTVGLVVLLGVLGAAAPAAPVTAALTLPPPDTSDVGATGREPDAGVPPLLGDPPAPGLPDLAAPGAVGGGDSGIPETVLAAYRAAETAMGRTAPGCRLTWPLVAGIGKVESGHAYGGSVDAAGTTTRPILGPALDGTGGNASIADTDGGALDRDTAWDRAVGPTQFIPTSWRTYGADGNADGRVDPDNVYDAALATGRYLCAGGNDLATPSGRHDAVFRYNHSESYVATVLRWADGYASGALPVPDSPGGIPDPAPSSDAPATLAALPQAFPTTAGAGPAPVGGSPVAPAPSAPGALLPGAPVSVSPSPGATPAAGSVVPGSVVPGSVVPGSVVPGSVVPGSPPAVLPGRPSTSGPRPDAGTAGPTSPGTPTSPSPASSSPASSSPAPSSTTPRPTTPPPSSTSPATTTPAPTTPAPTTTTTAAVASRCEKSLPTVARAFAVPAGQLTATTAAGPRAGQVACTVSRSGKAIVTAVVATTASAPAPAAPAGVHRAVAGGRVVLAVPPSAGVPDATARTALASLAAAWA